MNWAGVWARRAGSTWLKLPEDEDFDTVGGFVFSQLGHIPKAGETFTYENLRMTVTEAERTKVNRVKVERLESELKPPTNGT